MIPEEFFDRSINSLIEEIIKLRKHSIEKARIYVEETGIYIVYDGAIYVEQDNGRIRCIGDWQTGVPMSVPQHVSDAMSTSRINLNSN